MSDERFGALQSMLAAERVEERARIVEARARLGRREREERGLTLCDLVAKDETGLAGRLLVTYGRASGDELGATKIAVGAIVRVGRPNAPAGESSSGVVARKSRTSLGVVFDGPPADEATTGKVDLELEPSDATWERLTKAVRLVEGAKTGRPLEVQRLVLGAALPPGRPPRDFTPSETLNDRQNAAVSLALEDHPLALVHGPPGTGKTAVLVEVVRRSVALGVKTLVTAASNAAVDHLVERLAAVGVDAVRVGHPARVSPAILDRTLDVRVRNHEAAVIAHQLQREAADLLRDANRASQRRGPGRFSEAREAKREAGRLFAEARKLVVAAQLDVLDRANVVAATLTGLDAIPANDGRRAPAGGGRPGFAGRPAGDGSPAENPARYGLAVVDEAAQAIEPATYLALLRAPRVVLAGDHRQLGPTILSEAARAGGLGTSLFERFEATHPERSVMLDVQYRMHADLMAFPSKELYGGALVAHPSVAARTLASLPWFTGSEVAPLTFLDTAGRGFDERTPEGSESKENPGEAELVATEVKKLFAAGVRPEDVAVIAPYDAQVQLLRHLLADARAGDPPALEIDTVDAFQGREKEVVVVSLTRSNADAEVGFLSEIRRMNVALTRAKRRLLVVGDSATVGAHPFYAAFVEHAQATGAWRSAWDAAP